MNWLYLTIAGVMECGWAIGLKYAWTERGLQIWPAAGTGAAMLCSGVFLFLAQRTMPIGNVYAVWTGIGAVGTFALGIIFLEEPAQALRFLCVGLIVAGIIGLKLTASNPVTN